MKKQNLLVLGASGSVANAFLHHLSHHRELFNKIVLIDRNKDILSDPYIDHKRLNYLFIEKEIDARHKEKEYLSILKKYSINIAIDITDMETIPIFELTDKAGVNYINTAMNSEYETTDELVINIYKRKRQFINAAHILCTGMNPGVVNMLVRYGIEKSGLPKKIIHFEYDTSEISSNWRPMMTWCIHEFLVESTKDPGGLMLGKEKVKSLMPNALNNRRSMKSILSPIMKLQKYPEGLTVLHEENVSIAEKYNIPSCFIYAINQKTLKRLISLYKTKKKISKNDMILGDNLKYPLNGSDSIGVMLDYGSKKSYYFNTVPNISVVGTNATLLQVSVGIFAGLFTLLFDNLKNGTYFVEDLFNTHYKYYVFDNLRIQEFIFSEKNKHLKLLTYNPEIKLKRANHFEHIYVC